MSFIYDELIRELAFAEVAQDILRDAQNELYLNMRFLDVALSSLTLLPDGQIRPAGTDGAVFYFRPDSLAELFRKGRESVNRLYLHSILHCLFAHLWENHAAEALLPPPGFAPDDLSRDGQHSPIRSVSDNASHDKNASRRSRAKDAEYWNLACDIAVEYVIDGLYIRAIHQPMSTLRRGFYRALEENAAAPVSINMNPDSTVTGSSATGSSHPAAAFEDSVPNCSFRNTSDPILQNVSGNSASSGNRPALTAQRIYRYLCQVRPVQARLDQLKWEFTVDDHSRWEQNLAAHPNSPDTQMKNSSQKKADSKEINDMGSTPNFANSAPNQARSNSQNDTRREQEQRKPDASDAQKKWEDIRDRMQTELETFGKK